MAVQEAEGLFSPLVREARLRAIGARVRRGERVLDLACGVGYLADHLPPECRYLGVERQDAPPAPIRRGALNRTFLRADLLEPGTLAAVRDALDGPADVLVLAAFLEHVRDPAGVVARYVPLLAPGGRVIGSTPHPVGRRVHDSLARLWLCSRDGAREHERFLGRADLEAIARGVGGRLATYRRFLFGLNQLFVIEVPNPRAAARPAGR